MSGHTKSCCSGLRVNPHWEQRRQCTHMCVLWAEETDYKWKQVSKQASNNQGNLVTSTPIWSPQGRHNIIDLIKFRIDQELDHQRRRVWSDKPEIWPYKKETGNWHLWRPIIEDISLIWYLDIPEGTNIGSQPEYHQRQPRRVYLKTLQRVVVCLKISIQYNSNLVLYCKSQ